VIQRICNDCRVNPRSGIGRGGRIDCGSTIDRRSRMDCGSRMDRGSANGSGRSQGFRLSRGSRGYWFHSGWPRGVISPLSVLLALFDSLIQYKHQCPPDCILPALTNLIFTTSSFDSMLPRTTELGIYSKSKDSLVSHCPEVCLPQGILLCPSNFPSFQNSKSVHGLPVYCLPLCCHICTWPPDYEA
jgi:hypothetical protein